MFINNGGAKNSRKRSMTEVDQINLFNIEGQHMPFPDIFPNSCQSSQVPQISNATSPFKPFSLLTAPNVNDDQNSLSAVIKNQSQQIDQIIKFHSENLVSEVVGVLDKQHRMAEERASKKLKEKELELHEKLMYSAELEKMVERLQIRVRFSERMEMFLRMSLEEATTARRYSNTVINDAKSSPDDLSRVGGVWLDCKVCEGNMAKVMMWPCRHVSVCIRCNTIVNVCPICSSFKTSSLQFSFPINEERF